MDHALDLAWFFASDPIEMLEKIFAMLSEALGSQIKSFLAMRLASLILVDLNVIDYGVSKFTEICDHVENLVKAILNFVSVPIDNAKEGLSLGCNDAVGVEASSFGGKSKEERRHLDEEIAESDGHCAAKIRNA